MVVSALPSRLLSVSCIPLVMGLILASVLISACSPQEDKELTVMTWNIWHGGLHGSRADNFAEDTANTQNVLKVLLEESPDILFMQETYCCGMDIAREAGYDYSWRGSSNLSIHSKYPIIDTIGIFRPFNSHAAVIREAHPDPALTLEGTWGYLNEEIISDRIDYIYYRGDKLKSLDSRIVMDDPEGGFFNSDHRAVSTILEIY